MYLQSRTQFDATAKQWTEMYAMDGSTMQQEKIKIITDMGFSEDQAKDALSKHGWKEEEALNALLG